MGGEVLCYVTRVFLRPERGQVRKNGQKAEDRPKRCGILNKGKSNVPLSLTHWIHVSRGDCVRIREWVEPRKLGSQGNIPSFCERYLIYLN